MRIAIVAGEASGDLLGAGLIASLQVAFPDARFEGIAGPRMQARGCATVYPMDRLSVMGLFESFGRYPELIPFRHRLAKGYIRNPPDVFIGVDAPDFNLSLELSLRQAGIPTVHYVSPSVWAWRRYRIAKIKRAVDLMLTLFPFEADFYQRYDVPVAFVGHPLADEIPLEIDLVSARRALRIARRATVVALLPGSRMSEVEMACGAICPDRPLVAPAAVRNQVSGAAGRAGYDRPVSRRARRHRGGIRYRDCRWPVP